MVRRGHYHTVHLNIFSITFSDGIKFGFGRSVGEPLKFGQPVIVLGIDESELSAGKGNSSGRFGACFEGTAWVEIGAGLFELYYPPSADVAGPLLTAEHRTVGAHHPDRKKAVIATDMIRIAYVVMRIVYHKILKNRT